MTKQSSLLDDMSKRSKESRLNEEQSKKEKFENINISPLGSEKSSVDTGGSRNKYEVNNNFEFSRDQSRANNTVPQCTYEHCDDHGGIDPLRNERDKKQLFSERQNFTNQDDDLLLKLRMKKSNLSESKSSKHEAIDTHQDKVREAKEEMSDDASCKEKKREPNENFNDLHVRSSDTMKESFVSDDLKFIKNIPSSAKAFDMSYYNNISIVDFLFKVL